MANGSILPSGFMRKLRNGKFKRIALIDDISSGYSASGERGKIVDFDGVYSETIISYEVRGEIIYLETKHIDIRRTMKSNIINDIGW